MPVQGSVYVNGAQGQNQVTLPSVGLTIVGISQVAQTLCVATIPVDSQNNAQFLIGLTGGIGLKALIPFTMVATGQTLNITLSTSINFAVYYGVADPEAPSINDFIGVYNIVTITGTGTYSVQFNFPIPGVLTGILLTVGSSLAYVSFTTGIGYQLNVLTGAANYEQPLALANLPAPSQLNVQLNVLSTTGTSTSPDHAAIILYYSV